MNTHYLLTKTGYIPRVYLLAMLFNILNVMDNIVTYTLMIHGADEYNPIVAYLLKSHGTYFWLIDIIIAIAASILFASMSKRQPTLIKWAFISMIILTAGALTYDSYGMVYLIKMGVIIP